MLKQSIRNPHATAQHLSDATCPKNTAHLIRVYERSA